MIPIEPNEKVCKAFEVKSSAHGRGILYITTFGVAFESQKYGVVIDVSFEWLQSYSSPKHNRFHLVWDTPQDRRFSYVFEIDSAREASNVYSAANNDYANSVSELDALRARLGRNQENN
jgi:hypothetical protein